MLVQINAGRIGFGIFKIAGLFQIRLGVVAVTFARGGIASLHSALRNALNDLLRMRGENEALSEEIVERDYRIRCQAARIEDLEMVA